MAAKVKVEFSKQWMSSKDAAATFAYLSDLKTAIPTHFQGLASFSETKPGIFRWEFETLRHSGYEFQIKLLTEKALSEPFKLQLLNVPQVGNAGINASWQVVPEGQGSQVRFQVTLEVELPIPSILKGVAAPLVQRELSKFFDKYASHVEKTLAA